MASGKIFLSVLVTLIFFNIVFYLIGYNSEIVSTDRIIGVFITLGVIALLAGLLPLTDVGAPAKWLMSIISILSILYAITIPLSKIPLLKLPDQKYGVGLASSLIGMFSSDPASISFIPFLFFTSLSLIGVISGMMAISGGGD
jgi:hypothetical protein